MRWLSSKLIESFGSIVLAVLLVTAAESFVGPDIARTLLGTKATHAEIRALQHELGVDRPFIVRVFNRMYATSHGDLGVSFAFRRPVAPILFVAVQSTLSLVLPALLIGTILGLAIGIWVAHNPTSTRRIALRVFSSISLLPSLILCTWAVYGLSYKLNWLSPSYALAVAIVSLVPMAIIAHTSYRELDRVFASDSTRMARSVGFSEVRVIVFSLKPTLIAVTASFTNLVLYMLVSTVFVEISFSFSGLGTLLLNASDRLDYPVITAIVLLVAVVFGLMNALSGAVIYAVDPRTR